MKNIFSFFLAFLFLSSEINAQIDWGSWTSFQLNYKAGDKVVLKAQPIWRQQSNLSDYANSSIDFILSYKINSRWGFNLLNRHWFIPDANDRQFWFIDLDYKIPISDKIIWTNKLRAHIAVDWSQEDADFLRYNPQLVFPLGKKVTPFIGGELFYRLNKKNVLAGGRYKLGAHTAISNKVKLTTQYWLQIKHNKENPIGESHFIVVNLAYTLN